MLSFQRFCVLQAVESWHWQSCGIWIGVCVLWVCVQPPNPTTGCGDNILWGQPRVLPTGWHFWQPLIEPGVLNYSYRCYGERLPFSQEILTPRWIVAVSEHSSNDFGLWCRLGQMAAHSLSAHMLKAHTFRCFSGQSRPLKLYQPGFVFQFGKLGGNIWHLLISFSAIPYFITAVLMEIWTIWISPLDTEGSVHPNHKKTHCVTFL